MKRVRMTNAVLTIDLDAIAANWRALDARTKDSTETAGVVKANGYGLGAAKVAQKLAEAGARTFFVANAAEGVELRAELGTGPAIYILSGYMGSDRDMLIGSQLFPVLNSMDQVNRAVNDLSDLNCAVQLDSGMNRLGLELVEIPALLSKLPRFKADLVMSHLACADEPGHIQNATQLASFIAMSAPFAMRKSLAATGGTLLGPNYHFDLVRPGIGLYGGHPFEDATPVVSLDIPVIQTRDVLPLEIVGYGATWQAKKLSRIATISAGYADGILRGTHGAQVFAGSTPCPIVGRVSMDLITVDVTELDVVPDMLTLIGPYQTVDELAQRSNTIGYEILTGLGARYERRYTGA